MEDRRRLEQIIRFFRIQRPVKWIFYSIGIGLISGLFACLFFYMLESGKYWTFDRFVGAPMESPAGEVLFPVSDEAEKSRVLFFLLPIIGGLISGILVYKFAPEAEGHGMDALIDSFHNKRGMIRARVPFVKALATFFTLASGGSAGREGPVAQIGGGLGSWIARRMGFSAKDTRILLLAGTAGGLGAMFRSPLGGAITAIEVLYREDFETEALIPSIISSVTGYAVFSMIFGYERIFEVPEHFWNNPVELLFYAVLGLICVPVGIFYIRILYGFRDRVFLPLPIPKIYKPMLGGLGVACIGLLLPQVYGSGWGQIQNALLGELGIGLMFLIVIGKILATSFTISSGGSGGVFGPSLFIGGMLGGAVGGLCHHFFPTIITTPETFVLVGMCAFFAGVANAPIGAMLMITEMTGSYGLVVPLMIVSVIALLFTRRFSIYEKQVRDKFESPAHIDDITINVMEELKVTDVFYSETKGDNIPLLQASMSFSAFRRLISETDRNYFPVYEGEKLSGIVSLKTVRSVLFEQDVDSILVIKDVAMPLVTLTPEESLYQALSKFLRSGYTQIPVVSKTNPDQILGYLRHEDLMMAYNKEIIRRKTVENGDTAGKRRK